MEENFDFADLYPSQAVLLRVNDVAIVAVLNDACGVQNGAKRFIERITGPVTNIQLRELLAHFAVTNLSIKERPAFRTEVDKRTNECAIRADVPEVFGMEKPTSKKFGEIMWQTCGDIAQRSGAPDSVLQGIKDGQYTFLFKEDGSFNDRSVLRAEPKPVPF